MKRKKKSNLLTDQSELVKTEATFEVYPAAITAMAWRI